MAALEAAGWTEQNGKREWSGELDGVQVRVYKYPHWTNWMCIAKTFAGSVDERILGGEADTAEKAVDLVLKAMREAVCK